MARYKYDSLNRLVREDNKPMNKTTLFSYDTAGNITERCEYAFTSKEGEALEELACTHYSYDYEGDRLVSYNSESVAYNVLGNPTSYRGNATEWQYGNRLTKYGTTTFAYDGAGRRVSKGNITFTYDSAGNLIKQSNGLEFIYDNSGVIGLKYSGNTYFCRRDCQGNIIALIDSSGAVVVEYKYDAWGNHEAEVANEEYVTLANLNPFRYRGYYFDEETGLYFLQTRYYDPVVGRFISRDSIEYADPETICGLNLYAYCGNNPVMFTDETGTMPNWLKWLIGGIAFIGAVVLTAVTGGALAPVFIGMGVSIVAGGLIQGTINAIDGGSFWAGFADGAADGALWGGIFALGGAVLRTAKILTNGITIGENMTRVAKYANSAGQAVYKGMPGYNIVKFLKGGTTANKLAMAHNEAFIKRMMRWGVKITDIGMDISKFPRSQFYLMEASNTNAYFNLIKLMMLH